VQGARELADGGASRGGIGRECFDGVATPTMVPQTVGNRSGLTGYRSNRSGPVPV